nr:MAG TPA: hypothetical protein [Caudoviricetes sp.]
MLESYEKRKLNSYIYIKLIRKEFINVILFR